VRRLDGEHFDAAIIGCGMSGLAAGIRLAMFGRRVVILERHNAPGGLNSFYFQAGRKFDVGLHAVTNYVPPGTKGTPLAKLFRQLRIAPADFALRPQKGSRIAFPGIDLPFNNNLEAFTETVLDRFPSQRKGWEALLKAMDAFDAYTYEGTWISSRSVLEEYLDEPLLREMLLCPVCYYGSPEENDIAWDSFIILFNSLFREGFARPYEGVRKILKVLLDRFRECGGIRCMRNGVQQILPQNGRLKSMRLDDGAVITADQIYSSAGIRETLSLFQNLSDPLPSPPRPARLGFMETIRILDCQPSELGWEDTIVFFNDSPVFQYQRPESPVDTRSGVICFPNNYCYTEEEGTLKEGVYRITMLANPKPWKEWPEERYQEEKRLWSERFDASARRFLPEVTADKIVHHTTHLDSFTPRTVEKYTGHPDGAVYGSPDKIKDGKTPLENLFIIGSDQGFLGITGAMLSGISIANRYGFNRGKS